MRDRAIAVRKLIPLNFDNFEEFNEIFNFETIEGQENWMPMLTVVSYYEGVGALVKEGLLDIKFVALLICGQTINLWEKFAPFADEIREYVKNKRWASEWEFLYNELIKYLDEHPELKP